MTGDQVKAYLYLICESWLEIPRATLPNDMVKLAKMAQQSSEEWARDCDAIMECWKLGKDGRWHNERLLQVSKIQQKNFENGKKGGRPTKNNPVGYGLGYGLGSHLVEEEEEEEDIRRKKVGR